VHCNYFSTGHVFSTLPVCIGMENGVFFWGGRDCEGELYNIALMNRIPCVLEVAKFGLALVGAILGVQCWAKALLQMADVTTSAPEPIFQGHSTRSSTDSGCDHVSLPRPRRLRHYC
jgi:hypothetical protein